MSNFKKSGGNFANSTNRVWQSTFLKPVAPPAASLDDPHLRIKDRYHAPDGRDYPLLIQGLVRDPITMTNKARAIYYDGQSRRWRDITDTEARVALAREVEAGRLKVTLDWEQQL